MGPIAYSANSAKAAWGVVYEATDERLHRAVAVKVLPPAWITEDQRKRFLREAQSASALNHPNIVTVYDVGSEGGVDYIAMALVAGPCARRLAAKGSNLVPPSAMRHRLPMPVGRPRRRARLTKGSPTRLTTDSSPEWAPSMSWDGKKLAYISRHAGAWTLRTRDLETGHELTLI